MKCVNCDNKKNLHREIQTIQYRQCGLDNVVLEGVDCFICDKCGARFYGFGDQDQLHALIASILIQKKSALVGKELRFLRKYLGFSTDYFGKISTYDPSSISRLENDQQQSGKYDRFIRVLAYSELPNRNYSLQDLFIEGRVINFTKISLAPSTKGHWKVAA
ncbi:MAG: YgiT-type zinc finger protein [bacterium]